MEISRSIKIIFHIKYFGHGDLANFEITSRLLDWWVLTCPKCPRWETRNCFSLFKSYFIFKAYFYSWRTLRMHKMCFDPERVLIWQLMLPTILVSTCTNIKEAERDQRQQKPTKRINSWKKEKSIDEMHTCDFSVCCPCGKIASLTEPKEPGCYFCRFGTSGKAGKYGRIF